MKKLLLVSLCFLMFCITQASAQSRTVTGTVTAKEDGLPIPGATVKVQGAPTGTTTSVDGKFSISVPSNSSVLVVSFIGYTSEIVPVGTRTVINVTLTAASNVLNEVVVTGVGTATEKRRVPIEVATVSSKDFGKSATTDVTQALVGQIAGAQIQQNSGTPGSTPIIILRGYTNLTTSQPLIMVDGIQTDYNLLSSIDPSVVDHVEVVEGAAGGMLYGAKGGNGVIQIFLKKGAKNGNLVIDFSSKYSSDHVLKANDLVAKFHHYITNSSGQILDQNGDVLAQDSHGVWQDPQEEDWTQDKTVQNNKPFNLPTYDHIDQSYHTASTFQNSVTIRGGTEKADYLFSASNLAQQDVFSNNFNRTNITTNFGFNLAKGLTFRNNSQLIYTHEDLLGGSKFNEVNSYQWINFNYIDPSTGKVTVKPNDQIDGNNSNSEKDYHTHYSNTPRIVESADLNYKLPKFLEADVKYSVDYRTADYYDYYANQTGNYQPDYWGPIQTGAIQDQHDNYTTQYGNASLFFRTDFKNDFHLNIPIKTSTQATYDFTHYNRRYYQVTGTNLPPYPPAAVSSAATTSGGDYAEESLIFGFLVNQTIDWGNLFGISGGFRSDYSSIFGGQSKPFTFPRGTVYINPSEFFSNHAVVSNWKLRAAYAEAGVQPGIYDRQATFVPFQLGTSTVGLSTQNNARNPALQVQVTKEFEAGTDLTLTPLKGAWISTMNISFTYWKRTSDNVEQNATVAPSSGFEGTADNLISLKGNGINLSLDVSAYKATDFTWDLGARFATSKTEITKLSNGLPITSGVFQLSQGDQLGVFYGQTVLHSIDQVNKASGQRYIAASDASNYTLVNGNVVDTRTYAPVLTAANDISNLGNSNPDFTASLINRFSIYKRLSVSFQFDWVHGNSVYNQTRQWLYRDRLSADFDKPVTIAGNTGAYVAYYNGFYNTLNPVSWYVEDGSFVRLRDASLSYNFTTLANQKWLKNVVLTLSGRNLLTFTHYKGLDPETSAAVNNQGGTLNNIGSYRGVDYYSSPNLKSYQLSLNVGF